MTEPVATGDQNFLDAADATASPQLQLNYRRWLGGTILLILAVAAFLGITMVLNPQALAEQRSWLLLPLVFVYFSLAMTFLPLPTMPLLVWAAGPAGLDPLLLAVICTLGTGIANLHDYYLLSFLYRYKRVQKLRSKPLYQRAARWFDRAPFVTLSAASFLPIPIDVVRLLAISQRYPRGRFALASVIGRFPRYLVVALLTDHFKLGWWWVVAVLAATVLLVVGRLLTPIFFPGKKEASET